MTDSMIQQVINAAIRAIQCGLNTFQFLRGKEMTIIPVADEFCVFCEGSALFRLERDSFGNLAAVRDQGGLLV